MADTVEDEKKYPWSSLSSSQVEDFIDPYVLSETVKAQELKIEHMDAEARRQAARIRRSEEHIQEQVAQLLQVKTVSASTFETLHARVQKKEHLLNEAQKQLTVFKETTERLEALLVEKEKTLDEANARAVDPFTELCYQIIIHNIANHKAGYDADHIRAKTMCSVIRWLTHRKNVILYLRQHRIHAAMADGLERSLFVDEPTLCGLIDKYLM